MLKRITACGSVGVNKDLSQHDLPIEAWSDAQNVRFMNGSAWSFYGQTQVYGTPPIVPLHVLPAYAYSGEDRERCWVYCGEEKIYCVTASNGTATHTNLTPQAAGVDVDVNGSANNWTSTVLGGIVVVNANNGTSKPLYWTGQLAANFRDLPEWPDGTTCKRVVAFKNFLVALNITYDNFYPYRVRWSNPAVPGSLPTSWDVEDLTVETGEVDLAEGYDPIVDGLVLRDSLMIYKEQSVWRMDYVGGPDVFSFHKVLGTSGAMNLNCIVEVDGRHFVLTGSDVIVHDGQQATSVLDRQARRSLFQSIDINGFSRCFVFKSSFTNEVFVCYPTVGAVGCDRALVWNYVDQTVSYKTLPNITHASFGAVSDGLVQTWESDSDPWDSDTSLWGGPDFSPDRTRVLMAPSEPKILMLDGSASQDGAPVPFYLERRGLSLDEPTAIKTISRIRPRVLGNVGQTINIRIGRQDDPWQEPVWSDPLPFTIGKSVSVDKFVSGRYLAIRFESGTAFQVRLDSYDIEYTMSGSW